MKVLNNLKWTALVLSSILTINSNAFSIPVIGDYNGDGISDLAIAKVDRKAKRTEWTVRNTITKQNHYFWTFNVPADALVTGHFFGDGRIYPGIVYVRDARKPLEWYFKKNDGSELFTNFGTPGDTIPNQGDLDCDGITDLITTRSGTSNYFPGYRIWYIAQSGKGGNIVEVVFGNAGDGIGTADMDGDGCAEMIALRSGYYWYTRKLQNNATTEVQWGLPGDFPLLPQDFNGDRQADYVISRIVNNTQVAYVRYFQGSSGTINLSTSGPNAVPLIGKFNRLNAFAWQERATGFMAVQQSNGYPEVFAFGGPDSIIVRPDGTVIQPSDSGRVGSLPVYNNGDDYYSGGGSGGFYSPSSGDVNSLVCDRYLKFPDGRNNTKYRNSSSKGRKIMWHNDLYGEIQAASSFTESGQQVDRWDIYASPESGPRTRAYSKNNPRSMPKPEIIVARLYSGEHVCVRVSDPTKTID